MSTCNDCQIDFAIFGCEFTSNTVPQFFRHANSIDHRAPITEVFLLLSLSLGENIPLPELSGERRFLLPNPSHRCSRSVTELLDSSYSNDTKRLFLELFLELDTRSKLSGDEGGEKGPQRGEIRDI